VKPKAELMKKLRTDRAAKAARLGLVKLRIEMYVTPEQKERALKYVARLKRDA